MTDPQRSTTVAVLAVLLLLGGAIAATCAAVPAAWGDSPSLPPTPYTSTTTTTTVRLAPSLLEPSLSYAARRSAVEPYVATSAPDPGHAPAIAPDAPGRGVGLADEVVQTPWGSRNVRTGKWSGGGRAGVDPVDDFIEHALDNGYEVVGREIDIRTPFGTRRADLVLRHIESGRVGGIEIKSTLAEFNKFNRGQFAKDRFINSFGGRAFGVNAETADLTLVDYMMKIMWGAR